MNKEEIIELINEELETKKWSDKCDLYISFVIGICFVLCCFSICFTFFHNSEVDAENEKLTFCKDIYKSDNVVLEQCKEYFIIIDELRGNKDE